MYKFNPILKTLVWGTESWVLSGVPGNESVVAEGPRKGEKITDIYPGQFPLLIKFIDSRSDLSIQVHPNDSLAAARHGCKGKTEMWYIVGAGEGAHLLSGLSEKIGPEDYVRLVENDRIVSVLSDYAVAPGDVFFLPAGRIHAIGGGCFLAEIQQTSDITYRIYDYGRLGLDGKPRQLHTQEAKDAIDYTVYPDYRTHYVAAPGEKVELVSCPYFKTSLFEAPASEDASIKLDASKCGGLVIVIGIEGKVSMTSATETTSADSGETCLSLPEDGPVEITAASGSKCLIVTL
ncbi:MAG: class I mannose-6-phosphate isomerase [Bacteroidales bacterium]|nr:class I mannose-6-phosphate isomerase [Candidatus Cryptobacteroides aphodequi]